LFAEDSSTALLVAFGNDYVPVGILIIVVVADISLSHLSLATDQRGVDLDA